MMRSLGTVLFLCSVFCSAQDKSVAEKFGELISEESLKANLSIIASDAMEGRATGSRGQKMAAAFIQYQFADYGLTAPVDGNYYQPIDLFASASGPSYVRVGDKTFANYEDVIYFGQSNTVEKSLLVVAVASATVEDVQNADIKDKAVLLLINSRRVSNHDAVVLARKKGAKVLFVCNSKTNDDFKTSANLFKSFLSSRLSLEKPSPGDGDGIFIISPDVVTAITGKTVSQLSTSHAPGEVKTKVSYKAITEVKTIKSENVLGYLEGTDKKDEVLVITAHYDHIGLTSPGSPDRVNNGADDDGSGTVTVIELAKAFSNARAAGQSPRRSILFMTVTGEEEGLLGSDYYTQHPVFPLAQTVVNLNIDMIGRTDESHKGKADYVYVIGSDKLSQDLHQLSERTNQTYTKLEFDYLYNDESHPTNLYKRSDHWNFAKNNVPIIFYFDGIHEDYHKPSDEVDKIQFGLLAKRAKNIFYTAWEIANRDTRIVLDSK
jgi:hypothetical protein